MELQELVNLFINNGMAVCVVAYFLYRDNKYNEEMIILLNNIKAIVENIHNVYNNGDDENEN